ncbi:MAG: hypothetical protein ABUS48_01325 [Pseudomonadota bacterium]
MKLAALLIARVLDAVDILFDAWVSVLRVLIRGKFQPDAKSFRGERFVHLDKGDLFVQEIALNAADPAQARRAITLDPERRLPLSLDAAVFDVAGPIDAEDKVRARPERSFLLGVARKDALVRLRETLGRRANAVEAFVYAPADHLAHVLLFRDAQGDRRRRFRRGVQAIAFGCFAFFAWQADEAWRENLERNVAAADSDRVQVERRIRLAERRAHDAQIAVAAINAQKPLSLAEATERLSSLAYRQPATSELNAVTLGPDGLSLRGRAYAPDDTELELRRAFEGARVTFSHDAGDPPQNFSADIGESPPSGTGP